VANEEEEAAELAARCSVSHRCSSGIVLSQMFQQRGLLSSRPAFIGELVLADLVPMTKYCCIHTHLYDAMV
jgi:hypothetical protein